MSARPWVQSHGRWQRLGPDRDLLTEHEVEFNLRAYLRRRRRRDHLEPEYERARTRYEKLKDEDGY